MMQGKILMNDKFKKPVDCLMYILSELDDDKKRLREFCDAIIGDMADNGFTIVHEDRLDEVVQKYVETAIKTNMEKDKGFPRGAYFWG